jgi:hypothetical protein
MDYEMMGIILLRGIAVPFATLIYFQISSAVLSISVKTTLSFSSSVELFFFAQYFALICAFTLAFGCTFEPSPCTWPLIFMALFLSSASLMPLVFPWTQSSPRWLLTNYS